MTRALVLALVLVIAPAAPGAAEAQAFGGGAMAPASTPVARGEHRGGGRRHRVDRVTRWERSLERARARGNATGRDPWNGYNSMPSSRFARSRFAESRLPRTRMWSGSCWARDCGAVGAGVAVAVAQRAPAPAARAAGDASVGRPAFAPPAIRSLNQGRATQDAASPTYARRIWRGSPD